MNDQHNEESSPMEQKLLQIETYIIKLQVKMNSQNVPLIEVMDDHHRRLQESLVEVELALQHYKNFPLANLIHIIRSAYCDHIFLWRSQYNVPILKEAPSKSRTPVDISRTKNFSYHDASTISQSKIIQNKRTGQLGGGILYDLEQSFYNRDNYKDLRKQPIWHSQDIQNQYLRKMIDEGVDFSEVDLKSLLIKPIMRDKKIKILAHKCIGTSDYYNTKYRDFMDTEEFIQDDQKMSWSTLRSKQDALKKIGRSTTYDELMKLIRWLNLKSKDNIIKLNDEKSNKNNTIDLQEVSVEEFEQHLKDNYQNIQENALQILIKYFKKRQNRSTTQINVQKEESKFIKNVSSVLERRKYEEKISQLQEKIKIFKKEMIQKDGQLENYHQLSDHWQKKLNEQTKLFSEFRDGYLNQINKEKKAKVNDKTLTQPATKSQLDEKYESLFGNLNKQLEEMNLDNIKLMDRVTALNHEIDEQRQQFQINIGQNKSKKSFSNHSFMSDAIISVINQDKSDQSEDLFKIVITQRSDGQKSFKITQDDETQTQQINVKNQRTQQSLDNNSDQNWPAVESMDKKNIPQAIEIDANIVLNLEDPQKNFTQTIIQGKISIDSELLNKQIYKQRITIQEANQTLNKLQNRIIQYENKDKNNRKVSKPTQTDFNNLYSGQLVSNQLNFNHIKISCHTQTQNNDQVPKDLNQLKSDDGKVSRSTQSVFNIQAPKDGIELQQNFIKVSCHTQTDFSSYHQATFNKQKLKETQFTQQNTQFKDLNQNQDSNHQKSSQINIGDRMSVKTVPIEEFDNAFNKQGYTYDKSKIQQIQNKKVTINVQNNISKNKKINKIRSITQSDMKFHDLISSSKIFPGEQIQILKRDRSLLVQKQFPIKQKEQEEKIQLEIISQGKKQISSEDNFLQFDHPQTKQRMRSTTIDGRMSQQVKSNQEDLRRKQQVTEIGELLKDTFTIQSYDAVIKQQGQFFEEIKQNEQQRLPIINKGNFDDQKETAEQTYREIADEIQTSNPIIMQIFDGISQSNNQLEKKIKALLGNTGKWEFHEFKKVFKLLIKQHKLCGNNCAHLQRFYSRYGLLLKQPQNRQQLMITKQNPQPF